MTNWSILPKMQIKKGLDMRLLNAKCKNEFVEVSKTPHDKKQRLAIFPWYSIINCYIVQTNWKCLLIGRNNAKLSQDLHFSHTSNYQSFHTATLISAYNHISVTKEKLKKTSMQRKWILITLVLNSYPYYWKSFVMFSDMQSQFKDFWFFRKFPATFIRIQSSGGKSVGLFIGAQHYRNFPHWQDILHKAACYRKTKKYPKTDKKFKTTETHLENIEFL